MERKTLQPNQIMTTHDFPVHNEQILKIYFKICKEGHPGMLPPVPVIHKSLGIPLLEEDTELAKKHNAAISKYFKENPHVEYILCDGSHKTTALMLTGNPINVMVLKTDEDVREIRRLEETGDVFSYAGPDTIEDILIDMAKHFSEADLFQTVEDKTKRMVDVKVIPQFMINFYSK